MPHLKTSNNPESVEVHLSLMKQYIVSKFEIQSFLLLLQLDANESYLDKRKTDSLVEVC